LWKWRPSRESLTFWKGSKLSGQDGVVELKLASNEIAVFLLVSATLLAKVNPDDFTVTATVQEVMSGRGVRKVTESGRVRYGNQFVIVTEIGDQIYDLSGYQASN
jgi:hypothetical protein